MNTITTGVVQLSLGYVNVYFIGNPGEPWVLVDAGVPGQADKIRAAATERYGANARPEAILLTHGHVDHVGSAQELADAWDVPIYAHPMELPYVTGQSDYPPPDPTVGGPMGFVSRFMSPGAIDVGSRVQALPAGGTVPGLDEWRYLETPGHSPGQVAYFRERDATLIAGDACATMDSESFVGMLTKKQQVSKPIAVFTPDWGAARTSIEKLAALKPQVLACGHGEPMIGPQAAQQLQSLATNFSPPAHGRYVPAPARANETGVVWLPPPAEDPLPKLAMGVGAAVIAGAVALRISRRRA